MTLSRVRASTARFSLYLRRLPMLVGCALLLLPFAAAPAAAYPTEAPGYAVLWQNGTWMTLGSLGGPNADSRALDINNSGQVVGWADTSAEAGPGNYPTAHAFLWQKGTMTDLGTLGGPNSVAYSINDLGKVVGVAQDTNNAWHLVTWTKGTLWFKSTKTDLGLVGSRATAFVSDFIYHGMGKSSFNPYFFINASGAVAGSSETDITNVSAGPWHAFHLKNNAFTDFGTLVPDTVMPSAYSYATGLNALSKVVGYSAFAQTQDAEITGHRAFSWKPGGYLVNLGALPGYDFSEAWAVNDLGVVAGKSYNVAPSGSSQGGARACVWWGSAMSDLGTLGGDQSWAQGINVRGDVIGTSSTGVPGEYHGFLRTSGVFGLLKLGLPGPIFNMGPMQDLGTLGGTTSYPNDLNAARQVVGYSKAPLNSPTSAGGTVEHAFLWQNGAMQDLGAGQGRSEATAINTSGQVVGYLYPLVLAQ